MLSFETSRFAMSACGSVKRSRTSFGVTASRGRKSKSGNRSAKARITCGKRYGATVGITPSRSRPVSGPADACASAAMQPGDIFIIETPGGGGFGPVK